MSNTTKPLFQIFLDSLIGKTIEWKNVGLLGNKSLITKIKSVKVKNVSIDTDFDDVIIINNMTDKDYMLTMSELLNTNRVEIK